MTYPYDVKSSMTRGTQFEVIKFADQAGPLTGSDKTHTVNTLPLFGNVYMSIEYTGVDVGYTVKVYPYIDAAQSAVGTPLFLVKHNYVSALTASTMSTGANIRLFEIGRSANLGPAQLFPMFIPYGFQLKLTAATSTANGTYTVHVVHAVGE